MQRLYCFVIYDILAAVSAIAADPDFSGTWTLNEARSQQQRLPAAPWKAMKVEHKDTEVRCVPTEVAADPKKNSARMLMSFVTTGKEVAHPLGESSGKSIAKWEGSALLINTIVSGPRNYTQMDRWKLSRDGATLTVRRQIVNLHGESESLLVYEKPADK
jgi:hypothetical protein